MNILLTTGGSVRFPGLGLNIENLMEGFYIFNLHISLSGILIAFAMFLALLITERLAKKTGQNPENYLDMAIRIVLASVVGARVGYVLSHWQNFITDQESVFNISDGGMSAAGAVIAGLLVSYLYCRKKKLSWLKVCDTSLPGIVTGQMLSSLGCFFGRNMLGTYSDGALAMQVDVQDVDVKAATLGRTSTRIMQGSFLQVHPVALYETVLLFVLLILVLVMRKTEKWNGMVLSLYLMGYGLMVFAMEFIRLDSQKIMGSRFSVEHIIAAALFFAGVFLFTKHAKEYRTVQRAQPKNFLVTKKHKNK